jgi:iron(III) transport system ATP-binding protein
MRILEGAEPVIRIRGLRKAFGPVVALDGLDMDLRRGETLALLGPSGCGKTTLLRAVAGLGRPDAGTVEIGGVLVEGPGVFVPPERRRIGMVFQDVALFPHLSVAENVAFGVRGETPATRAGRVRELLELVGLPDAGPSRPHELSGGMQQRVALARALAPRPEVVLLDEPFANLDLGLRTQLRAELRRVLDVTGASALLVTHDQAEALTVADRVAVMRRGAVDQVASPEVIYAQPATPFVATFVGVANLVPAALDGVDADTVLGRVRLVAQPDEAVRGLVVVRPEHVDLEPWGSAAAASMEVAAPIRARILARRFAGAELHYEVALENGLRLWVEAGHAARLLSVGDDVALGLRAVETVAFSAAAAG